MLHGEEAVVGQGLALFDLVDEGPTLVLDGPTQVGEGPGVVVGRRGIAGLGAGTVVVDGQTSREPFTSYGLPVVITRCGNFYGGGDLNWNRIVPGTIRSVIRGERPVIRSDGSPERDFLYVEDAARA